MQQGKQMTVLSVKEKVALEMAVLDGISDTKRKMSYFAAAGKQSPDHLADELAVMQGLSERLREAHKVMLEGW